MEKKYNLVIDVDGVMTTGRFFYDSFGKRYKEFGPHDSEGLKMLRNLLNIVFITADKRGFPISRRRIEDMGYPIELVTEADRYRYVKERFGFENTFFIGDGISDAAVLRDCLFGVAPANSRIEALKAADYVTPSKSAEGAVCDACVEIKKRFFNEGNLKETEGNNFEYKVAIVAAGIGSRMRPFTNTINKALIPVNGKPAICHIIEKYPENVEIVIAVGYLKEVLICYLEATYPNRKLTFVHLEKWGEGTGPGYSLLACREYLQCPFIFLSADTLVRENVPEPKENYFGVALVNDSSRFCSAKVENGKIVRIDDKVKCDNKHAFIGLMGVKDYSVFWNSLLSNTNLVGGEIQISNGSVALMQVGMKAKTFTWFDVGTPEAYAYAIKNYPNGPGYR